MTDAFDTFAALHNACVDDLGHMPPWRFGEWMVIVSGRILGAVRGAEALGVEPMRPDAEPVARAAIEAEGGDPVDLTALRAWLRSVARIEKCQRCDGTGKDTGHCPHCDHTCERECDRCDGTGEVLRGGPDRAARVGGFVTSAYRLLLLVEALTASGIAAARMTTTRDAKGLDLLVLNADGVRAAITPSTMPPAATWPEVTP